MQLTTSSTSNYHFFTLFLILLVLIHPYRTSANSLTSQSNSGHHSPLYQDISYEDNDENEYYPAGNEDLRSSNPWSQLLHHYSQRPIHTRSLYSPVLPAFRLRNGEIRFISYPAQKRAIPIEFQKALFAHGIVGRRR